MSTAKVQAAIDIRLRFAQNVRRYREMIRMSKFQLAADAMIDPKTLCSIESGKHNPTLLTIGRLADSLGVPPDQLLSADTTQTKFELSALQNQFDLLSEDQQAQLLAVIRAYLRILPELE